MNGFDALGCVAWGALGGSILTMAALVWLMERRVR